MTECCIFLDNNMAVQSSSTSNGDFFTNDAVGTNFGVRRDLCAGRDDCSRGDSHISMDFRAKIPEGKGENVACKEEMSEVSSI